MQNVLTPRTDEAAYIIFTGGPHPQKSISVHQNGKTSVTVFFSFPDSDGGVSRRLQEYRAGNDFRKFVETFNTLMCDIRKIKESYMKEHFINGKMQTYR